MRKRTSLNGQVIPLQSLSACRLSKDTQIPQTRISQIIKGKRSITTDTALRLSAYFGNSAKFWLGQQNDFDIEEQQRANKDVFERIKENTPRPMGAL